MSGQNNTERKNIDMEILTYYDTRLKEWIESGSTTELCRIPYEQIVASAVTTIDPYKMYNIGTITGAITIAFNTSVEVSGYCREYAITFVAGANCSITLPSGVKYNGGSAPTYTEGRTYEIHICNGLAVVGEFY